MHAISAYDRTTTVTANASKSDAHFLMPVHSDSLSTIVTKTSHYSVAKKQIRNEYLVNGAAHTGYIP